MSLDLLLVKEIERFWLQVRAQFRVRNFTRDHFDSCFLWLSGGDRFWWCVCLRLDGFVCVTLLGARLRLFCLCLDLGEILWIVYRWLAYGPWSLAHANLSVFLHFALVIIYRYFFLDLFIIFWIASVLFLVFIFDVCKWDLILLAGILVFRFYHRFLLLFFSLLLILLFFAY